MEWPGVDGGVDEYLDVDIFVDVDVDACDYEAKLSWWHEDSLVGWLAHRVATERHEDRKSSRQQTKCDSKNCVTI